MVTLWYVLHVTVCVWTCGLPTGTILRPCGHTILSDALKGIESENGGKVKKRVCGRKRELWMGGMRWYNCVMQTVHYLPVRSSVEKTERCLTCYALGASTAQRRTSDAVRRLNWLLIHVIRWLCNWVIPDALMKMSEPKKRKYEETGENLRNEELRDTCCSLDSLRGVKSGRMR
jgi:hypothetical protein